MCDPAPSPAVAVHRALGVLRLQGFTGVLWVGADGGCTAEGVSTFRAYLWDQRHSDTVAAVGALGLTGTDRARVDVCAGYPRRQGGAWAIVVVE